MKEKKKLLFTFSERDNRYAVIKKESGELECVSVSWNAWSGERLVRGIFPKSTLDLANRILEKSKKFPERYPLVGEHYELAETEGVRRIKQKKTSSFLSFLKKALPFSLHYAVGIIIAMLTCRFFISTSGISWANAIFPDMYRYELVDLISVVQMLGYTAMFMIKREKNSMLDLMICAMFPVNLIVNVGCFFTNTRFAVIYSAVLIAFLAIYLIPKSLLAFSEKKKIKRSKRLCDIVSSSCSFLLILVSVSSLAIGLLGFTGHNYSAESGNSLSDAEIIADYEKALENINENVWQGLSKKRKVDTLQRICDYECAIKLGCRIPTVKTGYSSNPEALGEYSGSANTITVDTEHVETSHAYDVINTLLHEARHAWQSTLADMYTDIEEALDDRYKTLGFFRDAEEFRNNFENYSGGSDFEAYYSQPVERDSREWAEKRISEFYMYYIFSRNIS